MTTIVCYMCRPDTEVFDLVIQIRWGELEIESQTLDIESKSGFVTTGIEETQLSHLLVALALMDPV